MCKLFREKILQKTLLQLSIESGVNIKTISAFENGRSNNLNHLKIYVLNCDNNIQVETFFHNLKLVLKGVENE